MMWHRAKRALTSFSNSVPPDNDAARQVLLSEEMVLWKAMQGRDQKHSLQVLHRFRSFYPSATRAEQAAALLHDVGKIQSDLGWFSRIAVSIVGGRTKRWRDYLDHETIGAALLVGISEPVTIDLVAGGSSHAALALHRADNI